FGGQEGYEFEGGRYRVDDSSFLILNHGQRYTSAIDAMNTVESFCIWFRPRFAERVLASLRTPSDRLLDDPATLTGRMTFFERIRPHDELVSPVLHRIRAAAHEGWIHEQWLDEQFHLLMERLLQLERNV